ncbi:MAG: type II toxin-antitoxin system VapC family toxin [Alphaproteobacteria bacterium]|nr:type II toxin-antitoxin system VapC family toxin [Alphaproteobacteria bacterium]MBV9371046.1 type II toxin-antitoxin system VapC family toxin [Alphaproteobacteria bacterium]MBV9901580.1 type II toxin-antitoxin system VapC family toxin [Alphaproteobacteria bacterium]
MPFVPDASVVLAWHFRDEQSPLAEAVATRSYSDLAVVPPHWPLDVGNALLRGERRACSSAEDVSRFVERLAALDVEIDPLSADEVYSVLLPLARAHRLSVYDAAYLELAGRRGLPLATLDEALVRAAQAAGVELLEGDRS